MKKFILITLYILLTVTSLLYTIPIFHFDYKDQRYIYNPLPRPFTSSSTESLILNTPGFTNYYVYTIESNNVISNPSDWNKIASSDLKVYEQRLQTLFGSNYEIRQENRSGKIFYTFFTPSQISDNQLLISPNSVFEVVSEVANPSATDTTNQTTNKKLDFVRKDFLYAEYTTEADSQGNLTYAVRMPFDLLITPQKIALAKDNLFSTVKVKTGDKEYSAYFGPFNTLQAPTQLVVTGLSSIKEALVVKAFLNTESLSTGYNIVNVKYETNYLSNIYKLLIFIAIFLILPILVNYYFTKKVHRKQIAFLLSLIIIYFASIKLFDQNITISMLIILGMIYTASIFNLKNIYWLLLGLTLLLIKLLGVLNGFDLTWFALINLIGFGFLAWTTIYAQNTDKKYENQ